MPRLLLMRCAAKVTISVGIQPHPTQFGIRLFSETRQTSPILIKFGTALPTTPLAVISGWVMGEMRTNNVVYTFGQLSGDWNGDGIDTFGVTYTNNTFYYRDVFGWNPGPFEFSSQTFTTSISTARQVVSHNLATGGSSAPGPASPNVVRGFRKWRGKYW